MTSIISEIESSVQLYFDGLYEGNVEKLAQVFHSGASLFIAVDDRLVALSIPQWFERVATRPSPASQNLPRKDIILMIDRMGPVNAMVKVGCTLSPLTYTDHLSFIKFDGRWQIVAKSYCTN